jgi:hypothetical protein
MNDDELFERLRADAPQLRYEPSDPATWTRLRARVRERIAEPTMSELLAGWLRPVAAALSLVAILATLGIAWMQQMNQPQSLDAMASTQYEISMAGDSYRVGD